MSVPFRTARRVEFHHTDAAGIAHFSSFFLFMEQAEHDFLRDAGLSVLMQDDEGPISWPRVRADCDFCGPARFEDVLEIEVRLLRMGEKSVTYGFEFHNRGHSIAQGKTTAVCCRIQPHQPPRSIPIPEWIRSQLQPRLEAASGS